VEGIAAPHGILDDVWWMLWLLFGGLVILVVYNLIALIFGFERGFPILGYAGYEDCCSCGPAKIYYSYPTSAGYWLAQDR
jgi:hypothetical protein